MYKKIYSLINWFISRPRTFGFFVFTILSFLFTYIAFQNYLLNKENKRVEMSNTLNVITQNIEQSLKNSYTIAISLALTIDNDGIPQNFDSVGKRLLESNNNINAVELVPNGVIRYIYPLEGNEAAIGLDILNSEFVKEEALKSIDTQKMYFAGPLDLKQGGKAIVGRFPIYIKNKFWGFSAVVIKMDKMLILSGINALNTKNFDFQLSKTNPITKKEEFFLPESIKIIENNYVSNYIPDGDWKLYIIDKNSNSLLYQLIIKFFIALLVAFNIAFFTYLLLKKPKELQSLIEEQADKLINIELKFKTIFEKAALGIANVDIETGSFIEINEKFCKILGYSQSEMKGKNFQSITHPDDIEKDLEHIKKMTLGLIDQYTLEKRYFTKKGNTVWVNLTVTPFIFNTNDSKNITAISIVEDITLKKKTQELIKKQENHFQSLFEESPLPLREEDFSEVKLLLEKNDLMDKDINSVKRFLEINPKIIEEAYSLIKLINANKACLNLYKVQTIKDLLITVSTLFNQKAKEDFAEQLIAITQRKKNYEIDTVIKNSDNELRNIDLRWNVIRGYEKSLERIIVSKEDITEKKRNEKIIRKSQQRIESLINTIDGIVWECDVKTFKFNFISKKVENILGYTAEEWLSHDTFWEDHIYEEDRENVVNYCLEKIRENLNHDFEYRMVAKDGSIVWLRDIVNIVIDDKNVKNLRGIMINVTKNKEIQNELNNSFNLVTEQNKRLLNFSYIVSHNLRSHTSNISSLTGFIENAETDEERTEMIHLLKTVSNSLNETLVNLNEVVNIQTNVSLVKEKVNLKLYVENTLNILADQIKQKAISVNVLVNINVEINYNPAYLESILYNIISNAIRYSHPDRVPIITIKYYLEFEMEVIEISDNGIGIDLEKNKSKLFGMYKTFSNNKDSKGLGLFITKNQVDAMGGNITIDSEINVGTTFKIFI